MTKLEKWQMKYDDAVSMKMQHTKPISLNAIMSYVGNHYAILEGRATRTSTVLYLSCTAKLNGEKNASVSIGG